MPMQPGRMRCGRGGDGGKINCCLKVRVTNYLSLRTSPQTGVAIPRLEEKCTE